MKCPFDKLQYDYIYGNRTGKKTEVVTLYGFDSETYITGRPFLYAISDDTFAYPSDLLEVIFSRRYRGARFVAWNLGFDEASIFDAFPLDVDELNELREKGTVTHEGYIISSIPKKELKIAKGHKTVYFYDVAQFYHLPLDIAAERYLGKRKIEVETKKFTPEYVAEHWQDIQKYCLHDAKLTKELADHFTSVLAGEMGMYPQKLYSCGYIAGAHFSDKAGVVDVKRLWNYYPEVLRLAYNAYAGGKFEVYQRGRGYFYQYDINSAYPYEIMNLQDIRYADIKHSKDYEASATYGFLDCKMLIHTDFSPLPKSNGYINIFPIGFLRRVITKGEYDYLIAHGNKIEILDAWWLRCPDVYPYRDEVARLFALKNEYKGKDEMKYMLVKILLNSFYGKFIQVTQKYRKNQKIWDAGYLFNPVYAAIITANVRLRLSEVCHAYPDDIVAVHTDSVISTAPLEGFPISTDVGAWNFDREGAGVVVGTGVYQVGNQTHYRGFKGHFDLLELVYGTREPVITVPQITVTSWRAGAFRHKPELINVFKEDDSKILNLNFDTKRQWANRWNWRDELTPSEPLTEIEILGG